MSQHNLHVIPSEPAWVPDEMAARRAVRVLRSLLPGSRAVHAQVHPRPVFVDGSQLFERVACPACGSEIARSWWSERMSRADRSEFTRLAVRTPCCDTATSLTDLAYAGPAGFARFQLTVELPDRDDLTDAELAEVAGALGHAVRAVPERA